MSDNSYSYVYEVWADLFFEALRTDDPRKRIISLLLEFEGGIYNRALNDMLLNFEKTGNNEEEAGRIRELLFGSHDNEDEHPDTQEETNSNQSCADVIPFPMR